MPITDHADRRFSPVQPGDVPRRTSQLCILKDGSIAVPNPKAFAKWGRDRDEVGRLEAVLVKTGGVTTRVDITPGVNVRVFDFQSVSQQVRIPEQFRGASLPGALPSERAVLLERLDRLIRTMVARMPTEDVISILGAATDLDAFVQVLSTPRALTLDPSTDPLAAARARTFSVKQHLIERSGGCLTAAQVAAELKITPQAVYKRARNERLLAVEAGRHNVAFPAWQFADGRTLPGLEAVLAAFAIEGAWARLSFFLSYDPSLDATPVDALRAGRVQEVVAAATAYGEQA